MWDWSVLGVGIGLCGWDWCGLILGVGLGEEGCGLVVGLGLFGVGLVWNECLPRAL